MRLSAFLWAALFALVLDSPGRAAESSGARPGFCENELSVARIAGGEYEPLYAEDGSSIRVAPFWLARVPVTNAAFRSFVETHRRWQRDTIPALFADTGYLRHWNDSVQPDSSFDPQARAPVTNVSWFAARAYCLACGMRLPTLDEWEWVARADETRRDAGSDPAFRQRVLDWYSAPQRRPLPAVGAGPRNVYGVADLHGVIWEWVEDFNSVFGTDESRAGASIDRQLTCAGAGAGVRDPRDYAAFLRFAMRSSLSANYTVGNLGFRCARDIER